MKKIIYFVICYFTLVPFLTAQENKTIEQANADYFGLYRESIFLHLNKSTYVSGEEIWFKGYIYNRNLEKPYKETSNIYVGIYDSLGQQISKKLHLGIDGFFKGNIPLDSTLVSGSYYIKADTNWMKNFNEDDAFVQKISIINQKLPKVEKALAEYDFQLLAEGGHLLSDVSNTVGFKVIDQTGRGVPIKIGIVLDQNGEQLTSFNSNVLGIGKFNITPTTNNSYKAKIVLDNGKELITALPKAKTKGVALSVNNTFQDKVVIALKTNDKTLEEIADIKHKLLIHKDDKSLSFDMAFKEGKKEVLLSVNKENLFNGINIITLFDAQQKPLLERLFFNHLKMEVPTVDITLQKAATDSLKVNVKLFKKNSSLTHLSLSVLPLGTKSYNHKETILSTFLLKPYLKGTIENVNYYFNNINRKKRYDLDLLLLTQGWSRYEWNNIFNNPPIQKFEFENGVKISGRIANVQRNFSKQLLVHPTQNHNSQLLLLDDNNTFTLNNFFLNKGEEIKISVLNKKGKPQQPPISMLEKTKMRADDVIVFVTKDFKLFDKEIEQKEVELPKVSKYFFKTKARKLEEVTVTAKKTDRNGISVEEDIDFSSNFIKANTVKITQKEVELYKNVLDYVRSKGYNYGLDGSGRLFVNSNTPNSIFGNSAPLIFVDNILINARAVNGGGSRGSTQTDDLNILLSFSLANIEKVLVDKTGAGYGSRGSNGVIKFFTRRTTLGGFSNDISSNRFFSQKANYTFETPKVFYTPQYISYNNSTFKGYGIIHWEPELLIDQNGNGTFNMIDTGLENIVFYIEGMDEAGNLISLIHNAKSLTNNISD